MIRLLIFIFLAFVATSTWAATVGIKTFSQTLEFLSQTTGISPTTPEIQDYFELAKTRLPKSGYVEELNPLSYLSTTALSGNFCQKLIEKDAGILDPNARRAHGAVDFSKGNEQLVGSKRTELIESYTSLFWARSPSPAEFQILGEMIDEAQAAASDLPSTLLGVCTSVSISLESIYF